MRRVHTVFLHLQPVARPDIARTGHELVARKVIGVKDGEGRLLVWRPHVGEHQPTVFVYRIGTMIEAVLQRAIRWLSPASRGSCRQRRSASRDNSTESPSRRPDQTPARCRDADSAALRGPPHLSRNTTRSSPIIRRRRGRSCNSSEVIMGCQRRRYSPQGVPGPTWVSSASSSGRSRW